MELMEMIEQELVVNLEVLVEETYFLLLVVQIPTAKCGLPKGNQSER